MQKIRELQGEVEMTKQEAMKMVRKLVDRQKYMYTHIYYMKNESSELVDISKVDMLHLTFYVGEPFGEVQITLKFCEKHIDLLAFPHPIIIDKKYVLSTIRFINFLNSYIKSLNGRFYLDEDFLDLVFSARIPYYLLESYPKESIADSIVGSIEFFLDAKFVLFEVSKGIIDVDKAIDSMREIQI